MFVPKKMARNKRKNIKDPEKMKGLQIAAKNRCRQRKSDMKKCTQNALELAGPFGFQPLRDKSPDAAVVAGPKPPSPQCDQPKSKTQPPRRPDRKVTTAGNGLKKINPSHVIRSQKTLGCGTFGVCYLACYRGIVVAVRVQASIIQFGCRKKKEVFLEANI